MIHCTRDTEGEPSCLTGFACTTRAARHMRTVHWCGAATPEGGRIDVGVDGVVRLSVADTGPGVPAQEA